MRRRSVLLSNEKPKRIVQDYAAIDSFGELRGRKKRAAELARQLGHMMSGWHRRPNDPSAGRWNSSCATCNRMAVVCTEIPTGFTDIYGPAVVESCSVVDIPLEIV